MDKLKALLKKLGATDQDIAEAVAEIETDTEAEVSGLKKKNQELLAKTKATKGEEGGKVAELEDKLEELTASYEKSRREAEKAVKRATDEAKAAQDVAAAKSQSLSKLIRDEGLTRELVAVGVKKEFLGPVAAFLRDRVQVDEEKGEAFAMTKDAAGKEARKALAEYAKEWAASDEGKNFVGVPASNGGGSQGPGPGGVPAKTIKREVFQAMRPEDQAAAIREGVKPVD